MLLQPKKAQLKCVENHCFIITVPAPLSFNEPLSKVTESTGLQLWRGGLVQIQSFATQPQFLSSSSNLQTSPINPSIPVLLFLFHHSSLSNFLPAKGGTLPAPAILQSAGISLWLFTPMKESHQDPAWSPVTTR